MDELILVGRSSSLFTRVARIFASELEVPYAFKIVPDLGSRNRDDYAGNPSLKIPALQQSGEMLFGTLNVCRALAERAAQSTRLLWPENLPGLPLRNAHELTQSAMTTEVSMIMAKHAGVPLDNPYLVKMRESLTGTLQWLDNCLKSESGNLCGGDRLSFFETSLYCLVTHLQFREILDVSGYTSLLAFRDRFGERPAAKQTPFAFDAVSVHR